MTQDAQMTQKVKLFLSLKFKNTVPKFNITPAPVQLSDTEYEFTLNAKEIFKFSVTVEDIEIQSALIIDKIKANDVDFYHLDSFGVYKTSKGVKKTYGYMDEIGSYNFKIRFNPISHHYLFFLLNSKK